jgi:hypothetical protein
LPNARDRIREETAQRAVRASRVRLVELTSGWDDPPLVSAGTLGCFWGAADSPRLAEIVEAVRRRDGVKLRELLSAGAVDDRRLADLPEDAFAALGALGELRYGGRMLLDGLHVLPFVPDHVGFSRLAYSGGKLSRAKFSAISWTLEGATPLDVVVVANPPGVEAFERKLIDSIPTELSELHLRAEPQAVPAAVATVVATWAANKALDAAYDKTKAEAKQRARAWAQEHARQIAEAKAEGRRKQLAQARANRTQYRNGGIAAMPTDVAKEITDGLDPTAGVRQLLEVRRALLAIDER